MRLILETLDVFAVAIQAVDTTPADTDNASETFPCASHLLCPVLDQDGMVISMFFARPSYVLSTRVVPTYKDEYNNPINIMYADFDMKLDTRALTGYMPFNSPVYYEQFRFFAVGCESRTLMEMSLTGEACKGRVSDFINSANASSVNAPFIFTPFDAHSILVHNTNLEPIMFFNKHGVFLTKLESGFCTHVRVCDLFSAPEIPLPYFLVPDDLHVCSVFADLHRKKNAGAYQLYEDVIMPKGYYASIDELAHALNSTVRMKGERNGGIFKFVPSAKRPVLRIIAHHRQPLPSQLGVTCAEGSKMVGLAGTRTMFLGNKKFIDFDFSPRTFISSM